MWKEFLLFELRSWLRGFMVWIFLLVIALLIFLAASSDSITVGASLANLHRNAPYVIQRWYGVMSILGLLMTTAIVNASATRDFASNAHQIVFTTSVRRFDYLFGRFAGSTLIAMIPSLGISVGIVLAQLMPWVDPERWGPIYWSAHAQSILAFVIPNTIFVSAIVFSIAILTRSTVQSFLGSILLLVAWGVSNSLIDNLDNERLSMLLDPFGLEAFATMTKYWTPAERNRQALGLEGMLLLNRLVWLPVGLAILGLSCMRFRFEERASGGSWWSRWRRKRDAATTLAPAARAFTGQPATAPGAGGRLRQWWGFTRVEFLGLVRSTAFVVIVVAALLNTIPGLYMNAEAGYGNQSFPVTYRIVEMIQGTMYAFLLAIITYYAGVLVWRERDARFDEIHDALPYPAWMPLAAKLASLLLTLFLLQVLATGIGMAVQASKGYTRFQPGIYGMEFFVSGMTFFYFVASLAFLIHVVTPNKYFGYFAFVVFLVASGPLWIPLDVVTKMVNFADRPNMVYSDLYGYAPFLSAWLWFTVYWLLLSTLLLAVATLWWPRGRETELSRRVRRAELRGGLRTVALAAGVGFALVAGWVFYNTKIVNTLMGPKETVRRRAEYEKRYRQYQALPQPRVTAVRYRIDLVPERREVTIDAEQTIENRTSAPITELHFTDSQATEYPATISLEGAQLRTYDRECQYLIYTLSPPLAPGERRTLRVRAQHLNRGFTNDMSTTELVQSGSFFNNTVLPQIGYLRQMEVRDPNERRKHGLPPQARMPALDRECKNGACDNTYLSHNSDWVSVETVISTAPDQIAIAPGSKLREWTEDGRRFFHYKLDRDSLNFYSFLSARYTVARERWNNVDLEVYHHADHTWNVPKMLSAMRKSLDYYTTNFGPYYHRQARIIEFPRVASFAQAFPGTMPYSESIGFIAKIVDPDDIDFVYYVVAHEMAHQWWAHQLVGADMQGATSLSESLSQYSALMVMEREYGRDMMRKFLQYEMDRYLRSRGGEQLEERPLLRVESSQGYVHYQKASVALYYLKEMIGEAAINRALRKLIEKYAYQGPPYPTSYVLLDALRAETPAELQYLLKDLFEDITLFSNRTTAARATRRADGKYDVTVEVELQKLKVDGKGGETVVPVDDWIEVGAFAKPAQGKRYGRTLHRARHRMQGKSASFTFVTDELPEQAGVDPFHLLIDRVKDDNMKKVGGAS